MNRILGSSVGAAVLGTLALSAVGCGKNLPKLTDDQKVIVADTIKSVNRGANVVMNIGPGPVQRTGIFSFVTASIPSRDEAQVSMEAAMRSARDARRCIIDARYPEMSTEPFQLKDLDLSIKVSGNQCPVNMTAEISTQGDDTQVDGRLSGRYSVRDPEFAKLNDVTAFSVNGKFSGYQTQEKAKGELSVEGTLTSQKHGKVNFSAKAEGESLKDKGEGKVVASFVFPAFEAEFTFKVKNNEETYEINGEKVSKEEFERYFEGMGIGWGGSRN